MAILIALAIALVSVAFVAAPLFFGAAREPRSEGEAEKESFELQELEAEKETVYAAIQELDFDFKSGKLSAEDHDSLRQRYEERAAIVLKTIDDLQAVRAAADAPRKTRREKRKG